MAKKQANYENKGPAPRGGNSLPVFQLGLKFGVIAECLRVGTKPGALAAALDITERKITDAAAPDTSALSPDFELELVEKLKARGIAFDPKWPQWSDLGASKATPIDQRRDTVDAFRKRLSDANPPIEPPPTGTPLTLEDRVDTKPPVSRTLGNVSIVELSQGANFVVGADGFLSAIVRCHEAKWGGLAVAATSVTLTLIPKRPSKRSANPAPLKDIVLFNGHGDRIIVERLDRYVVRVRTVAEAGKKARPIGEIELPGALWAILDMQVGDEFECEMWVLLRDVSAEPEPDDTNALITPSGDPVDNTMMLKLEKRFEQSQRIGSDHDSNRVALLHKPCVALAPATWKA
jgi:hypothetical protein